MNSNEAMLTLSNLIADALERIVAPDTRFALVIWCDGDDRPMCSTSNEFRIEIARDMLKASAGMIDEVEIFAHHDNAGHA